jgi:hypothetical protein
VKNFTTFEPKGEVDDAILADEPEVPVASQGFPLDKILASMIFFCQFGGTTHLPHIVPGLLDDLARGVYRYMTLGEWPISSSTWKELVAHGIARYKGDDDGQIDEPLALKSLLSWLLKQQKSLERDIFADFDSDRGTAWERALVVCLTRLLKTPTRLDTIMQFKYPTPLHNSKAPLGERRARLIVGYDGSDYNTDIGDPSMWSLDVVLSATTPDCVRHWLERGKEPWCRPPKKMGPDLLCWLQLDDGSRILLAVQAKCRDDIGNMLPTTELANGIRSLTPSSFWQACILFCVSASSKSTISLFQTRRSVQR